MHTSKPGNYVIGLRGIMCVKKKLLPSKLYRDLKFVVMDFFLKINCASTDKIVFNSAISILQFITYLHFGYTHY